MIRSDTTKNRWLSKIPAFLCPRNHARFYRFGTQKEPAWCGVS
jgi:hypothetical protein